MTLVLDSVAGGFRMAARRWPLVLADMVAKTVWLGVTLVVVASVLIVFLARLSPSEDLPADLGAIVLLAGMVTQWKTLVLQLVLILVASGVAWSVVEAFVRSRIFRWTWGTALEDLALFTRFLASGMFRRLAFLSAAFVLAAIVLGPALTAVPGEWNGTWAESRWGLLAGAFLLVTVAFVLMMLDTLLRCDAIGIMDRCLGPVIATVATIGLFEAILRLSAVLATMMLFEFAPVAALVAVPLFGAGLSIAHSYLLLVRYSAIGIMRGRILDPYT